MKEKNWILKQQKDVRKVYDPKINYDKEHDILSITWFPQLNVKYSLETDNGFVFDISEQDEVKGIEIFDFKKKLK